jgi:nuclear transport factor 2 (NTF2) superfamily protein
VSVRPPLPPFDKDSAAQKVQSAEDGWNTRNPERVASAYTRDSVWRNRDLFITGHDAIVEFLTGKWERELDYVLRKSLWAFDADRIAVRFQYEWHDHAGDWFRSYGNELWEFDPDGLMRRREASINDVAIAASDRRYFGPRGKDEIGKDIPLH